MSDPTPLRPITILTDFGSRDSYVAEMKGVILRQIPRAVLIDVSHDVPPGDVASAAYLLGRAWVHFPEGTVHLCVVDPSVGTDRAAIALEHDGHFFVAPDNGVLSRVIEDSEVTAYRIQIPDDASSTFHGRDVFAPAAAALAAGEQPAKLGEAYPRPVRIETRRFSESEDSVVGEIVYVDRFGNLVTNIPAERARVYSRFEVGELVVEGLSRAYADREVGEAVALIGSHGTLEVAVRLGSASKLSGARIGARVRATR